MVLFMLMQVKVKVSGFSDSFVIYMSKFKHKWNKEEKIFTVDSETSNKLKELQSIAKKVKMIAVKPPAKVLTTYGSADDQNTYFEPVFKKMEISSEYDKSSRKIDAIEKDRQLIRILRKLEFIE